ncbi:MAG: uncharacterized protein A8A55_1293 [Amphiamblys sp. WSBS2006]|nr:MAG: uncharacterized protein A8A55_1293 [Amphiamblys sp. WSBS2006]
MKTVFPVLLLLFSTGCVAEPSPAHGEPPSDVEDDAENEPLSEREAKIRSAKRKAQKLERLQKRAYRLHTDKKKIRKEEENIKEVFSSFI